MKFNFLRIDFVFLVFFVRFVHGKSISEKKNVKFLSEWISFNKKQNSKESETNKTIYIHQTKKKNKKFVIVFN